MGSNLKTPPCGARNRSGGSCRLPGVGRGGRCRFHGGRSTGPPKGSRNHWRTGIYSDAVLASEAEIVEQCKTGSLDAEAVIQRVRYRRAVLAEAEAIRRGHRRAAERYHVAADRILGRLLDIERTRHMISEPNGDPDELARRIREAWRAMEEPFDIPREHAAEAEAVRRQNGH